MADTGDASGFAPIGRRELRGFLYSFHVEPNGEFWPLFAGDNVLGRAESGEQLDIAIADPTTSSRHAIFTSSAPSHLKVHDAGSTNGTFVNDQPIGYHGAVDLRDGDRVRLGGYNAVVRLVSR
jgi:pSer/pThr/pTyr-binding forkhead associated (FHA) protein